MAQEQIQRNPAFWMGHDGRPHTRMRFDVNLSAVRPFDGVPAESTSFQAAHAQPPRTTGNELLLTHGSRAQRAAADALVASILGTDAATPAEAVEPIVSATGSLSEVRFGGLSLRNYAGEGYRLSFMGGDQPHVTQLGEHKFHIGRGEFTDVFFGMESEDPTIDRPEFLVDARIQNAFGSDGVLHFRKRAHIETLTVVRDGEVSIATPLRWDSATSLHAHVPVQDYIKNVTIEEGAKLFINGMRMKSLTEEWTEPEVPAVVVEQTWDPEEFAARMRAVKATVDEMPETVPAGFGAQVIEPVSPRRALFLGGLIPTYPMLTEYKVGNSAFDVIQEDGAPENVKVTKVGDRLVIEGDGIKTLSLGKDYYALAKEPLTFEVSDATTIYLKEGHTVHIKGKVGRVLGNKGNVVIEEGAAVEEISQELTVTREVTAEARTVELAAVAEITHEPLPDPRSGSGVFTTVHNQHTGMVTTRELTVAEYAALTSRADEIVAKVASATPVERTGSVWGTHRPEDVMVASVASRPHVSDGDLERIADGLYRQGKELFLKADSDALLEATAIRTAAVEPEATIADEPTTDVRDNGMLGPVLVGSGRGFAPQVVSRRPL